MFKYKHVVVGFVFIVLVVICLGIASLVQLSRIGKEMDNLYRHPFLVSNAANNINFHLVSMHRYMKDVVLAENAADMERAVALVAKHQGAAMTEFDVIFDRFLGEPAQINQTYRSFMDWQPIRDEVIRLVREGHRNAAYAITKGRGADHVAQLNQDVGALVAFAFDKAQEFHRRARENEEQAFLVNSILAALAVLLVAGFAISVVRSLWSADRDRARRNHLIDQHIMLATLNRQGEVVDASNALCRFLGCVKSDIVGKPSHFFDNSDNAARLEAGVLNVVQTGKAWQGEIKHEDPEGRIHWANSSVLPDFNEQFELTGFTNILVDVTNKKLSVVDKLTSLLNRRRFDEIIVQEMRSARRYGYELTLAIVDIDFFKKYNDCYGHPQGDKVLRKVAEALRSHLKRPNDYAFRLGGEEFALLFSRLDKRDSEVFLDRIRQDIEALGIVHEPSQVCHALTISIGAQVVQPEHSINEEALYTDADKALYQAKVRRNAVVVTSTGDQGEVTACEVA